MILQAFSRISIEELLVFNNKRVGLHRLIVRIRGEAGRCCILISFCNQNHNVIEATMYNFRCYLCEFKGFLPEIISK